MKINTDNQKDFWYYQNTREEMVALLPREYQKVLEVGCGEGNFTRYLKSGCEVWGVEPSSSVAKVASQKIQHVLVGKYEDLFTQLPNDYFDLVICNDVIEHMYDHDAFFRSIRDKMKPESYIVGSVPNVRHYRILYELLFEKDWKYREMGVLDNTHLRFFTEKSLKRTLNKHGFQIDKFAGINSMTPKTDRNTFLKNTVKIILFNLITIITLGLYRDVRFPQWSFRVKKINQ